MLPTGRSPVHLPQGATGGVKSHCPYGCRIPGKQLTNEAGFCKHLVGFSEDGKTMEVMEEYRVTESGGAFTRMKSDPKTGLTVKEAVKSDDVLVPMHPTITIRVYRSKGDPLVRGTSAPGSSDSSALLAMIEDQNTAMRAMQAELAELRESVA